jgi:outer membrane protein TolC
VTKDRIWIFARSALIALAAAATGRAQDSAPTTVRAAYPDATLDAFVAEALQKNGDVAASVASAEAASSRISPAQTLPDPFLSFNYQNDGWAFSLGERDMTFLGATFAQPLPWPGKLRLAGEEAAQRAEEVRVGEVGRARLSVEGRVRRAYWEYLLAREQLLLIEDRDRAWRQIADVARERYAVGLGAQQDALRAQVEVLRLDEARADEGARAANRRAALDRLLGRPQDAPIKTTQHLELRPEIPPTPALLDAVKGRSPELAALENAIEAGRSRVALTKKAFLPDFVASGGPMYRGSLDPMWQVGVGVTLPIHVGSRQKPLLAAAEADVRSQESRLASAALDLELRTRERLENLSAAVRVAGLYKDGVVPTDELSLESAIASYRTGKVPFVTVLEALNALYADRALYLSRLADAEKWRADIDEAAWNETPGMPRERPGAGAAMTNAAARLESAAGMR